MADGSTADPGRGLTAARGIRPRVLLLLLVAILVLTLVFVSMFVRAAADRRAEDIARAAAMLQRLVEAQAAESVGLMRSLSRLIMADARLAAGLRARDRGTLFRLAEPTLRKIRGENGITHFYFILPDGTMLLRVQQPNDWGDRIDRQVLRNAQRTGQPAWGNEQGPFGTLTLRVVHPWLLDGELIGYFELGVEFEDLMKSVVGQLDMEVYVAADKHLFDRQKFESAKKAVTHPASWDEFPNTLVLSRTGPIPAPVAAHFRGLRGGEHERRAFEVSWDGRVSQAIVMPFTGVGGGVLGETVVLRDVTAAAAESRRAVVSAVSMAAVVAAALMAFFYVFLGRLQRLVAQRSARLVETERKLEQEHAELLRMNAVLEQRVAERTAELQALVKELETFTYAVAHDLRTPLGIMSSYAGMVKHDFGAALPEDGRRMLNHISDNADQMARLLENLLAFARLGQAPVARERVAMDELARQAARELGPGERGAASDISVEALPHCDGDAAMLKQVWTNLLANALKYSRTRANPRIKAGFDAAQGAYYVRDNGVGFDMKYAGALFGMFQRLHDAKQFEGTGVGLAIVDRIVQRHGGRIWAQAHPEEGATFYFTIP